jgi:mono/diheme cytochrome c family protein
MFKRISILAVITLFGLAIGYADQGNKKVVIPVDKTSPADAKQMYKGYCAPCHGVDGRGAGPVAGALKKSPTDLTTLARSNDGKFPQLHVVSVLRFGDEIPAHGTAAMPVWGRVLANMEPANSDLTDLRITNLTRYLESIQRK